MNRQVNMLEAKTQLSKLVDAVESGAEEEIVIARDGKPAARLIAVATSPKVRLGLAKGKYPVMTQEEFDADKEEIWRDWNEKPLLPSGKP